MIEEFDSARDTFGQKYLTLGESLAKIPGMYPSLSHRFGNTAYDILSFLFIFKELHLQSAEQVMQEEVQHSTGLSTIPIPKQPFYDEDDSLQRLRVVYKALFYFIRTYQDAIYGVILVLLGQKAGSHSRMSDALKSNNIAGDCLRELAPQYLEWFEEWRDKRNKVKEGVNFGIVGPGKDLGISFSKVDDASNGLVIDLNDSVRLSDVIGALEMSSLVTDVAISKCDEVSAQI